MTGCYSKRNSLMLKRLSREERLEREKQNLKKFKNKDPNHYKYLKGKFNSKYRGLGYVPINTPFDGCCSHHINANNVVYIPREMHILYPHRLNDIESMVIINDKVWEWFWTH